jgi:hypothetical protein
MSTRTRTLCTKIAPAVLTTAFVLFTSRPAAAQDVWTGNASPATNWTNPANWQAGTIPLAYDSLTFQGGNTANVNGFTNGAPFDSITFGTGGQFNLNGNSVLLSGQISGINSAVVNNSGVAQTISLNLNLDWGYYTFVGNAGTLAIKGAIAWFDPNVTSTSLTLDATTGLISGLEGNALMFVTSTNAPSGLATISGGNIVPYTGYASQSPGNLPTSANNLQFTTTTSSGAYNLTANSTIYSITSQQTGTNGTAITTDTINPNGFTLTFGNNGGFYLLGNDLGDKACANINSNGWLTAGSSASPASLIFAVNGNNPNNQLSVNCAIKNNAAGGPVTLITTGPGTMNLASSTSNSYSGGTYVTEGQLQFAISNELGTGPVYVASNATLYYLGAGTFSNNLYLTSGYGAPNGVAAINGIGTAGAFAFDSANSSTSTTLSGTLNLMGAPTAAPPGCRLNSISSPNMNITGQITGTGTLDLISSHTGSFKLSNPNTNGANANNWQGGVIVDGPQGTHAVNVDLIMGGNNQIPSGANAGNVTLIPAETSIYSRFDLNGTVQTINGLVGNLGQGSAASNQLANFGSGPATLTFGMNNATATFYGLTVDSASAPLNLIKVGSGTETFISEYSAIPGAWFTYRGNTTISNGSILLGGYAFMNNTPVINMAAGTVLDGSGLQNADAGFVLTNGQTLNSIGTINGGTVITNGTVNPFFGAIGTLALNPEGYFATLCGGSTFVVDMNNATGAAGADPGWSLINVVSNSTLYITATAAAPVTIKLVSLTGSDVPGSAAFNPATNNSWRIIQTPNTVQGFNVGAFTINASAFVNDTNSANFSVSSDGNNVYLNYTAVPVITNVLVDVTNVLNSTVSFTVGASGSAISYQWYEGVTPLYNGGTSAGGATVTITTNLAARTSTLTLAGVTAGDTGNISVDVTNNIGSDVSSATLTVVLPPTSPSITQSQISPLVNAGGINYLTATANGTTPFTYTWSLNGTVLTNATGISGASSSTLGLNVGPTAAGTYTVVISNLAGSTSTTFVIGPVTYVPNQMIYEPFTSYAQMTGPTPPYTWENVTNLYNQVTGEPAYWYHYSGSRVSLVISPNLFSQFTTNGAPGYPWPGLAGNSSNCMDLEVNSGNTDNDHLQFWVNGPSSGQSVYFSFILTCTDLGSANIGDCIAAFCSSYDGTSFNLKLETEIQTNGTYWLGLCKGAGITGNQGVDADALWVTNFQPGQDVFVVGLYKVNSGAITNTDDTVSMWFDPTNTSFGSANAPTPTLGPSSFGVANSSIHSFAVHGVELPGNRYMSDLRIGTTWASVTPTSAPNLTLNNVTISPGAASAVLASENAGNPVTTYSWYFNGNPTPLTDGPNTNGDGSIITNSSTGTLTIIGPKSADLGTYTVVGQNTDPVTLATLTGSASATLSYTPPTLRVVYSPPNVLLLWPTNWTGYTLEQALSLNGNPINWTTNNSPPYGLDGTGTNYQVTVSASSPGVRFFRLKN